MARPRGYIAISRGIFDHPFFLTNRPLTRLEAWEWLINEAAWQPKGNRNKFGVIHTERGQLTVTRRDLAKRWRWSKSRVDRFLLKLVDESMISVAAALNGPKTVPETAPIIGYPRTMITICNYDKFQKTAKTSWGQRAGQRAGQNDAELPLEPSQVAHEPDKQSKIESRGGRERTRSKPHHGAKGRGMIWLDFGTDEWRLYATDYMQASGAQKLPENRIGGRGNWFILLGQGSKKPA